MATFLVPADSWDFSDPIFQFDCDLSVERQDAWKWTQYAIESGAEISDFGVKVPRTYSLSGLVTAWQASTDDEVWTRLTDVHAALVEYADTRQPVTVLCGTWVDDVVIVSVSGKTDQKTGEALEIQLQLQSYEIAEYEAVEIPASLLAKKVKASAQTAPTTTEGGAQVPAEEEGRKYDTNDSTLKNLANNGIEDTVGGVYDNFANPHQGTKVEVQ